MKIKSVQFYKSYSNISQLPSTPKLEMAFLGRSNVGKSSLINHLCNSKNIAKTSSVPGKTQLINFFDINKQFYFIDLPGYGYAKTNKNTKQQWQSLIEKYLQNREQLKVIFFLLDIRRKPNEHDKMINNWLKNLVDIKTVFVLTKYDKLSKSKANQQRLQIALDLMVDKSQFIFYSTLKNIGKKEVLSQIDEIFNII